MADEKKGWVKTEPEPALAPQMTEDQFTRLLSAIRPASESGGGITVEQLAEVLDSQRKAGIRENPQAPMISIYNPDGDRDAPKKAFACPLYFCGYPLELECLDLEEVALLRQVKPGRFYVTKPDGTRIKFDVLPREDDFGRLERLDLNIPCKTLDQRVGLGSFKSMLREVVTGRPEHISIADLIAENAALRQQLVPADSLG